MCANEAGDCRVEVPDDKVSILSSDDNINVEADGEVHTQ